MTTNQAFETLRDAGGLRAARVIIENTPKISKIKIWRMARALRRGVPVAKIIHQKWFYGLKFYTNRYTLDPRPDTETLVESVIADYKNSAPRILDLGTGTGCIIAAIIKNIPNARGVAVERAIGARRVARKNVSELGLAGRIRVKRGNFNLPNMITERFDVIVSNPPYIAYGDTRVTRGAQHDPGCALYARHNGLYAYEKIAQNAHNWIADDGKLYLEIGAGMGDCVREIFIKHGWRFEHADKDLAGIERVLIFTASV